MTILTTYKDARSAVQGAVPPPVREIAYKFVENSGDNTFDKVRITFLFAEDDFRIYSRPDSIEITFKNISTGISSTIRTTSNIEIPFEQIMDNTEISVKCVNFIGESILRTFFLPVSDIIILRPNSDAGITIKKSLDVINRTKDEFKERPRWLMLFRNLTFQDIQDDFNSFIDPDFTYNQDGLEESTVKFNREEMRAEVESTDALCMDLAFNQFNPEDDFGLNSSVYYMKYSANGWIYQDADEVQFIETFKDNIANEYQNYMSKNGLDLTNPVILKFILEHPERSEDSIIIYLMEGLRWQL